MKTLKRHPIPFRDPDGTPCVRIPLSDGRNFAELYADDYQALLERGITGNWQHNVPNRISRRSHRSYVQCHVPLNGRARSGGRMTAVTVARLIANAPKGRKVYYRDGNTLNLRRDNLRLRDGYTRLDLKALLALPKETIEASVGYEA